MPGNERQIILVATGADRPGVLDDLSMFLHERHGTILESRVSMLRGSFGLLLLVRGADEELTRIVHELPALEKTAGIRAEIRQPTDAIEADVTPMRLLAAGTDAAEAVHRISHLMRVLNVNIDDIRTKSTSTSKIDHRFELEMDLAVPRATPVVMMKQYVDGLAREMNVQCQIDPM